MNEYHDIGSSMKIVLMGNHEDINGNPVPYTRMTQRSKYKSKAAIRYLQWKRYVQAVAITEAEPKFLTCLIDGKKKTRMDCMIYFANKKHGDPENIRKGIQDALFKNDKRVIGCYDFDYDIENPRVEILIWRE